ncbi:MAG: MFS transporter [Planctomycetia bacterium]|nr:MFS transporter [Planctomycetia bacterium]
MQDETLNRNHTAEESPKTSATKGKLWTKGFIALLITQFMVALNDNFFRWLIVPIGKCAVGWSDSPDQIRMFGALAFLVPFLILTTYAGYCTDRFNRRTVIIACKIAELLIVLLGTAAILTQNVPFIFFVLFLLGAQAAFFSPAKYSSLPSIIPYERISEANGYYSMTTMVACVLGQILGGILFVLTTFSPDKPVEGTGGMHNWWMWAAIIIGVAVFGLISSLFIPSIKAANTKVRFPLNPFTQTLSDLWFLFKHKKVAWIAMGSAFFWGLGALAQSNIDKFATETLNVRQDYAMLLLVGLTFGLAAGAVLAGWWSRGRVELGLVPIGVAMIILFAFILSFTPTVPIPEGANVASPMSFGFFFGGITLFLLGLSSCIYDIPLLTSLQTDSPEASRGRILAAYNFFSFAAMAFFSMIQGILTEPKICGFSANAIWFFCVLISLPVAIITIKGYFFQLICVLVHLFLRYVYHPRVIGLENIPEKGGVLLVGNHASYLDSLLIYCSCKRNVRFIAHQDFVPKGLPEYIARKTNLITILPGDRKSIVNMIREAREALSNGEIVAIFPEGALTRTGQIKSFEPGFLALLKGNENIPIVPFFLGDFWNSIFSCARSIDVPARWPQRLMRRMTLAFGKPFYQPKGAWEVRDKVVELGVDAMDPNRFPEDRQLLTVARQAIRNCRKYSKDRRIADSTGLRLNGKQTLLRILVFRRIIHRYLAKNEKFVGIILPTAVGGVLGNAAAVFDRRIPVNLNYTFNNDTNNYCIEKTGIKHILTSRRLLQKLPNINLNAKMLIIEDIVQKASIFDKLGGLFDSLLPTWILERKLGLTKIKPKDLNTIVFTSGSTGLPKGAMLTESNVASNVYTFMRFYQLGKKDLLYGMLPLFHSFGYTTGIWTPLMNSLPCFYHYSPLESRTIGELAQKEGINVIASTPTFLRNYLRRCPKENFAHADVVVPGAEKMPKDLADAWFEKFGQVLSEGFGMTELSPVLAGNLPPSRNPDPYHVYRKEGSIGSPIAGFAVRIVDPVTNQVLPPGQAGMMEVKGPSVMAGYYRDPQKTEAAFHEGWFITGDIAIKDEDGFIFIKGRESRMSKIGGEMVPHVLLEEKIAGILREAEKTANADKEKSGAGKEENGVSFAVSSVADQRKGEKIVVLYTSLSLSPEEICRKLAEQNVPLLWIPAAVNFRQVEKIPLLGTGKLDLAAVRKLSLSLYGQEEI